MTIASEGRGQELSWLQIKLTVLSCLWGDLGLSISNSVFDHVGQPSHLSCERKPIIGPAHQLSGIPREPGRDDRGPAERRTSPPPPLHRA